MQAVVVAYLAPEMNVRQLIAGHCPGAVHLYSIPVQMLHLPLELKVCGD